MTRLNIKAVKRLMLWLMGTLVLASTNVKSAEHLVLNRVSPPDNILFVGNSLTY
ncbi:MAG: hypothetical protein HWE26_00185 [Alteromonadaceae bacterium]|nr:hypothetical protein [Alteromonadaceae bacterium]